MTLMFETKNGEAGWHQRSSVEELAAQALRVVSSKQCNPNAKGVDPRTEALAMSVVADDPNLRRATMSELMESGVSPNAFIHHFAGDAARYLGQLWSDNHVSFADVTIGTARIQEMVRQLVARRAPNRTDAGPKVLIAVPLTEDHVLGGLIAADAFDALGCMTRVMIGRSNTDIARIAKAEQFSMIGLSISSKRTVSGARQLIKELRDTVINRVPIVLSIGTMTDDDEIKALTGADIVTSDPRAAVAFCNLRNLVVG
ncbi:hypothetical protein [Litoreibacter roseus]|uniref:B12-binding domain-containing protein n=1 Tax=Litoreibacter roseus TaxID=2601869 RepID=A0A6N6JGW4_9RHOB|nr:hypothetical protein [Litoreibacter roseus]GFE64629.1 hypothetical protein KIN_17030 [Litoreibacter roseus]